MYYLENEQLKISVAARGAELQNIYGKETNLEYLWSGDPAYWAKKSPLLFPIVGTLRNDRYDFGGRHYQLPRHGFAREMEFTVTNQNSQTLSLLLESNPETLSKFPFHFKLSVSYFLDNSTLRVEYRVVNTGNSEMYFSIGGHPAFRLPLDEGLRFEDYYLKFSEKETTGRWPVSPEGLIEALPVDLLNSSDLLPLTHELFNNDALVLKYPESDSVQLKSDRSPHGFRFDFKGFPFLGIWSYKNAEFLCIEPWCGIADSVSSDHNLLHKEGINLLTPGQEFIRFWSATFY